VTGTTAALARDHRWRGALHGREDPGQPTPSKSASILVKWEGYGYEENSWVSENDVSAPDKIREFYDIHPRAPW